MKLVFKSAAFVALLSVLVFGCMQDEPLQAPEQPISALVYSTTVGTETLGPIDIPLAAGSGVVSAGVGLREGQPDNININVSGTVKQVILYWEGQQLVSGGDDTININGTPVVGTLIGGSTFFYSNAWSSTYRADITSMGVVSSGANSIAVSGMDFTRENNGAGIIVIYDDGSTAAEIQVVDGNDCCFYNFSNPLDRTEPQTFTFTPSSVARTATLVMMASSVASDRPNIVRVTVGAVTTEFVDIFHNLDGPEFDTSEISVPVPAGETSLTVQCYSEKHPSSVLTGIPASLCWMASSLAIVPEDEPEPGSLGDFVWEDMDADGIQDSGEPGVSGVTVELYSGCGDPQLVGTEVTDGSGNYLFTDLTPGDYMVKFILPSGWFISPQDQGADNAKDSDADPSTGYTACITLGEGQTDLTWDAGIYRCASLGDFVWEDMDADGIQDFGELGVEGVTVELYMCGETSAFLTTTTDSNGEYLFDCLTPGSYFVKFVLPSDWYFSPQDQGVDNTKDSDADPNTGETVCTTLVSNETDITWDAGMYRCANIGDFVWNDLNKDGIQDPGEPGLEGIDVHLFECDGRTPIATTTTDSNGEYGFLCLTPGSYYLKFFLKSGYNFTKQDQGADDSVDSDAGPSTGETQCTTLESNETDLTWDAGMVEIPTLYSCTPGYWKNHEEDWAATGFALTDDFDSVFGTDYFSPNRTLFEGVWSGGGGYNVLARHGTAALLNAAHPDLSYPLSVAEVIEAVQNEWTQLLVDYNEDYPCPLPIKIKIKKPK